MEENKIVQNQQGQEEGGRNMGGHRTTVQTGAQNGGGDNIDQEEDEFTEDLKNSGTRKSSNTKE